MNPDRRIDLIAVSLMALATGIAVFFWSALPADLVIHWGAGGEPDSAVSKPFAIFGILVFGIGIIAFIRLAPDSMTSTPGGQNPAILFVGGVIAWVQGMVVGWNLGYHFDVWLAILPILVGAGLLVVYERFGFSLR